MSPRRDPRPRRVLLRRCEDRAEAERWAIAYKEVLRSLEIADFWKVRIDPADAEQLMVGLDYLPRELQ